MLGAIQTVLELLTMLVEDESSDSEAEEDLEMLYILSAFGSTKEKGEGFDIEKCDCTARVSTVHFHCTARVSTVSVNVKQDTCGCNHVMSYTCPCLPEPAN